MTRVGVLGIGQMGRSVSERLIKVGYAPAIWNRTRAKAEEIVGASIADNPAEVANKSDVVLSLMANDKAIESAYFGEGGLCKTDLSGTVVVEFCTTLPQTTRSLEQRVVEQGGLFLECPVGGSIGPAQHGKLFGMAGGSSAAFDAARPVLEHLTRRLEHLGPVGTGTAMKLAINLPLMIYWSAIGEAIGLATTNGIPAERAFDILVDSSGAIAVAKNRVSELQRILETGEASTAAFALSNGIKDMKLMEALATANGVEAPTIKAARRKAEIAAASGWETYDTSLYGMHSITG